MKTIPEIEKEINDILRSLNRESSKQEVDKAKRDVVFLRQIKLYLETNPREEYINNEINSINTKIEHIGSHYEAWKVGRNLSQYRDPYAAYLTFMGLSGLKAQLKTLKFILS